MGGMIRIFVMNIRGWDKVEYPSRQRQCVFLDV